MLERRLPGFLRVRLLSIARRGGGPLSRSTTPASEFPQARRRALLSSSSLPVRSTLEFAAERGERRHHVAAPYDSPYIGYSSSRHSLRYGVAAARLPATASPTPLSPTWLLRPASPLDNGVFRYLDRPRRCCCYCQLGAEAIFADLGHFTVKSIQLAFTAVVFPCLLIAYMGQAAYLMKHPLAVERIFYDSVPEVLFWPVFVIATLAATIASQAMIAYFS